MICCYIITSKERKIQILLTYILRPRFFSKFSTLKAEAVPLYALVNLNY
jgi:hypothetical protein